MTAHGDRHGFSLTHSAALEALLMFSALATLALIMLLLFTS